MLDSLYQKFEKKATWPMVTFLLIACLLCVSGFGWRNKQLGTEIQALDGRLYNPETKRFLYSPSEVKDLFTILDQKQTLQLYAISEITLDLVFPLLYVSLLTFLTIRVFSTQKAKILMLWPILGGLCDLLENFTITGLAFSFQTEHQSNLSYLAAFFTGLKWTFLLISGVILLIGSIRGLWKSEVN